MYPMRQKDDVFQTFKIWLAYVENQTGKSLKCLRSDNGGEYVSKEFDDFLALKGIKRELPPPHNPSQNGVAERLTHLITGLYRIESVQCCHMLLYLMGFGLRQ